METAPAYTNRLIHETSPYLRQHAHNPVDWYPWGEEALRKAKELDRPIFLSIGYSACHWCHVMEHESFEDPEIAQILNDNFINIKVDREERPDLDQLYMTAVQILTQSGGWPMSVFLTPDQRPFYGGTYFPPDNRYNRPSFRQVLQAIIEAWKNRREEIEGHSTELTQHIQLVSKLEPTGDELNPEILRNAVAEIRQSFDSTYGGFGIAPKFPHAMELRMLLRAWQRFSDDSALHMVTKTLDGMAMGGMYDHLGGGFHRYSTDQRWLVPHFEKMLYDNALLPPPYLEAYQATGEPFYREVVEETLQYILREMTSVEGAFYSTQDADSEGVEGKSFVWSKEEIEQALGDDELSQLFCRVYDVTPGGNWEGTNILHRTRSFEQEAKLQGMDVVQLRQKLDEARRKLLKVRSQRIWPNRDEKVLTSWNALMINAFAQAAQVIGHADYTAAAVNAANFLLHTMRTEDGKLYRTYSTGAQPKLNGYLEDYAFFADALVTLYETTFDVRWLEAALELTDVMIDQFWDDTDGGFFYTGKDHEQLIHRAKDPQDSSIPSGNSVAVTALLRLAKLTGRTDLFEKAEKTLQLFSRLLTRAPHASGQMLIALDFYFGPIDEFAVVGGEPNQRIEVLNAIARNFRPNKVVASKTESEMPEVERTVAVLAEKKAMDGQVTTYICRNFACQQPLVGVEAVKEALAQ